MLDLQSLSDQRADQEEADRQKLVDGLLRNLVKSDKELEAAERRAAKRASKLQQGRNKQEGGDDARGRGTSRQLQSPHHTARHAARHAASHSRGHGHSLTPGQAHRERQRSNERGTTPNHTAESPGQGERVRDKYSPLKGQTWIHRDHDEDYARQHPKFFAVRHVADIPTTQKK